MNKIRILNKFITFLLILIIFMVSFEGITGNIVNKQKEKEYLESKNDYIILLKDKPLLLFRKEIKSSFENTFSSRNLISKENYFTKKINEYKDKLESIHSQVKSQILSFLEGNNNKNEIFKYDFTTLLNGITVKNIDSNLRNKIVKLPLVKSVSIDKKIRINLDQSVPLIRADEVWHLEDKFGRNITGEDINVAIIDTGIDYNHSELSDNYKGGHDYFNNDTDPFDDSGHGTMCAGIVEGVAPNANIYSYKILNEKGIGSESDAIACIEDIIDPNHDGDNSDCIIDVISMSFGDNSTNVTPDDPICLEVDRAVENGIVMVAAAGNDGGEGKDRINSPGCSRKVICVGASTKNDRVSGASSWGPVEWNNKRIEKPDLVAPGVNIYTTYLDNGYRYGDGTSFATPHVAGAVALILQSNNDLTPDEVKQKLKENAIDLGSPSYVQGAGRIDVYKCINETEEPGLTINIPSTILESKSFNVTITKNSVPEKTLVIFLPYFHLPQIRYGDKVEFNSPEIKLDFLPYIKGRIWAIKIVDNKVVKKDIEIENVI